MANPPAREKQAGFAIAKGWWKEAGRQLGAEGKQSPECQFKHEFAQQGACLLWKGCGNGHGARLLPLCCADGETEAAREGLCLCTASSISRQQPPRPWGIVSSRNPSCVFPATSCSGRQLPGYTDTAIPTSVRRQAKPVEMLRRREWLPMPKADRKASYPRAPAWSQVGKLKASCRRMRALPAALAKGW